MEKTITVRRMGGSLGSVFPKEMIERLKVAEGDRLFVIEHDDGVLLTPYDPKFGDVMEAYEVLRKRYRNTLRELAK